MNRWRDFGSRVAAATMTVCVVAVMIQFPAGADPGNPTFITGELSPVVETDAFAFGSVGLTPLTLYPGTHCNRGQAQSKSLASVNIPGVLTASALKATCAVSADGTATTSRVTIGELSLLGGRVKVSLLDARCTRSPDGTGTVGATWGSLVFDQNYARNGSGAIVIPGLAEISVNEKYLQGTLAYGEMLLVHLLPQQVAGGTVLPDQALAISGCVLYTE